MDSRVGNVEAWEAATRTSTLFVLEVPWLPVDLSVRQLAARIFESHAHEQPRVACANDIARLVFNHGQQPQEVR